MDVLIHKHGWAVNLMAVAWCAALLGHAGSSALQMETFHLLPEVRVPPRPPAAEAAFAKTSAPIVARNVFCSTCPSIGEAAPGRLASQEPRRTALPIQLLAVNHVMPAPGGGYATAVLRDTESRKVGAFATGDRVKRATVTRIEETRVHLDNAGTPEILDLLESERLVGPVPALAAPAAEDPVSQELARGLRKLGNGRYQLPRAALDSVLGNLNLLSRSARIEPLVKEGRAAGFRLSGVRPGGPFDLIGLQNGDVISSINGLELTSPERAFDVYARLKSASHLSLGIERGSQRISNEYSIR